MTQCNQTYPQLMTILNSTVITHNILKLEGFHFGNPVFQWKRIVNDVYPFYCTHHLGFAIPSRPNLSEVTTINRMNKEATLSPITSQTQTVLVTLDSLVQTSSTNSFLWTLWETSVNPLFSPFFHFQEVIESYKQKENCTIILFLFWFWFCRKMYVLPSF